MALLDFLSSAECESYQIEQLKKGQLSVVAILFCFIEPSFLRAMITQVSIRLQFALFAFPNGEDSMLHCFRIYFCVK